MRKLDQSLQILTRKKMVSQKIIKVADYSLTEWTTAKNASALRCSKKAVANVRKSKCYITIESILMCVESQKLYVE